MNTSTLPSLYSLYWNDRAIRFYVNGIIFMVLVGGGIPWATTPVPGAPPQDPASPEVIAAKWAPLVTSVVGIVLLSFLLMRWSIIRRTLSHGRLVKGKVEKVETYSRQINKDSSASETRHYTHSYWATISYEVNGIAHKFCLKLPFSPSACGVIEGRETDLLVLESSPHRPLIKSIYEIKSPRRLFL
jgi:hypothetical protein